MSPKAKILQVLDEAARTFTFPMLDNGYVYLAAARLSAYAAKPDWALVIEVFGFSPRASLPDLSVYTFASQLYQRNAPEDYVDRAAYESYLEANRCNEFRSAFPIDEGDWQDADDLEVVAAKAREVAVRGAQVSLPPVSEYAEHGIVLEEPSQMRVYELCRFLAATRRAEVLGTPEERRVSVPPHFQELLVCDAWHHPDIAAGVLPSETETFQQLAQVLVTEDVGHYRPTRRPNTHWSNWPEGGLL
ncbi:MAG: hypothetical protein AAF657_00725 [Acidobacteriota bacterium]